jgi:hypothetical protein
MIIRTEPHLTGEATSLSAGIAGEKIRKPEDVRLLTPLPTENKRRNLWRS